MRFSTILSIYPTLLSALDKELWFHKVQKLYCPKRGDFNTIQFDIGS